MKTIYLLLVCFTILWSCTEEQKTIQLKNNWGYSAAHVNILCGSDSFYVKELYPSKVSKIYQINSDIVTINYYITEGHIYDTFYLAEGDNILILKNKY